MIKSKIWSGESAPSAEPSITKNNHAVWIMLAAIILVSVLVEIIRPIGIQPLDLFIWRPVLIICSLALSALWLRSWFKKTLEEVIGIIKSALPWAIVGALVFGVISIWPQDLGSLPLTLSNLPGYFFSLGFWPLTAGPESILRGFAFGLGVAVFWNEFKASRNDLRAALGGVGTWLVSSFVLALPSIVLNVTVAVTGGKVWGVAASDLANAFSRLNLNTFWANLQLTRWFTGFGGQLPNSMALYTLSWVFVLSFVLMLALYWRPRHFLQSLKLENSYWPVLYFASAVVSGLLAGWGKMAHSGLDLVAWLVFIILLAVWFRHLEKSDEPDEGINAWLTPLVLISGGLLGWPVLLPILASLIVVWIERKPVFQAWPSWLPQLFLWLCLAAASLGFMRGSQYVQEGMVWIVLAFGCLIIPAIAWFQVKDKPKGALGVMIAWLAVSLVSSLLLKTYLVCALAALGIVAYYLWSKYKAQVSQALPYFVLIYVAAVMILAFWLPRLLNPRLLPL
ncbi:MAG: hypothetical protein PHC70_02275 [Patescibacteria group bacterium]|nr:hypothetical protein [Patescibacteria group bacterium]